MKPEIKREFVKRLRKTKQCKLGMKDKESFSSDGLICQMYLEAHPRDCQWVYDAVEDYRPRELFVLKGNPNVVSPAEVEDWAGIVHDRLTSGPLDFYSLCQIDCTNDFTLDEIADLVEEQW